MEQRDWPIYRCYGFNLASDATFTAPLSRGDGTAEVTFTLARTEAPATEWHRAEPTYASEGRLESGESALCVYRGNGFDYDVVRFTELSDYYLWPDRIVCHLHDPAYGFTVELYLLGMVFSLWLECRGTPALHASAVVRWSGDRAIRRCGSGPPRPITSWARASISPSPTRATPSDA
jgi:hypothetical protein